MKFKSILLFSIVAALFYSCSQNNEHQVDLVKLANDSTQYKLSGNIDVNTLHAFFAINSELKISNYNLDMKNKATLILFDKQFKANPSKGEMYYKEALKINDLAQKLCAHIDSIRVLLISKTEKVGWSQAQQMRIIDFGRTQNYSVTDSIMLNDSIEADGFRGKAHELKMQLADYRKKILSLITTQDTLNLNIGLRTLDVFDLPYGTKMAVGATGEKLNWEHWNFAHHPLPAIIVILNEIENDVKSAELRVLQQLLLY